MSFFFFSRVLSVGGHLVLLLSLQLSAQLKKIICKHNQHANSSDAQSVHTDPTNANSECTDTPENLSCYKSSSETPILITSLQTHRTHKVSLGSTDAFIHTFTKVQPEMWAQTDPNTYADNVKKCEILIKSVWETLSSLKDFCCWNYNYPAPN